MHKFNFLSSDWNQTFFVRLFLLEAWRKLQQNNLTPFTQSPIQPNWITLKKKHHFDSKWELCQERCLWFIECTNFPSLSTHFYRYMCKNVYKNYVNMCFNMYFIMYVKMGVIMWEDMWVNMCVNLCVKMCVITFINIGYANIVKFQ